MAETKRDKPAKISFRGTDAERVALHTFALAERTTMDALLRSGAAIARRAQELGMLAELEANIDRAIALLEAYKRADKKAQSTLSGLAGVALDELESKRSRLLAARQREAG